LVLLFSPWRCIPPAVVLSSYWSCLFCVLCCACCRFAATRLLILSPHFRCLLAPQPTQLPTPLPCCSCANRLFLFKCQLFPLGVPPLSSKTGSLPSVPGRYPGHQGEDLSVVDYFLGAPPPPDSSSFGLVLVSWVAWACFWASPIFGFC